MKSQEIYTTVTNRIIAELEAGTVPWTKPWKTNKREHPLPHNAATHRFYSGINILLLWDRADEKGFARSGWLTFGQCKALGARVRKGEKGTRIVFVKHIEVDDEETDEFKTIPIIKSYVVFNLCQMDDLPEAYNPQEKKPEAEHERIAHIEAFIAALNITIAHGSEEAAYNPKHDTIVMPHLSRFEGPEHYYATLLHEMSHASGHKSRLHRDLSGRFGSQSYAAEELVAELSSAYLCAYFGIEGQLRHASYLEHWLGLLKEDNRAIFTAAGKAQQAMNYLLETAGIST